MVTFTEADSLVNEALLKGYPLYSQDGEDCISFVAKDQSLVDRDDLETLYLTVLVRLSADIRNRLGLVDKSN